MTHTSYAPAANPGDINFAEMAVGGVEHRNSVQDLTDWTPDPVAKDHYVTWMRFTADLPDFMRGAHVLAVLTIIERDGRDGAA